MKITVAKGRIRHEWTVMIEIFASVVWPTQFGGLVTEQFWMPVRPQNAPSVWVFSIAQLRIENVGSRIQVNAIVVRATGAAQGSRTRKRRNHLPRKSRTRAWARIPAPTTTTSCDAIVNRAVFHSAWRKIGSFHSSVKFAKPTQLPCSDPEVAFVKAR